MGVAVDSPDDGARAAAGSLASSDAIDDAGRRVRLRLRGAFVIWRERDYDGLERAAIARSLRAIAPARKTLSGVSTLMSVCGMTSGVSFNLIRMLVNDALSLGATSRVGTIAGLTPFVVTIALFLVVFRKIRVPASAVEPLVAAGLCGRCGRRLDRARVDASGLVECPHCHLSWLAARFAPHDGTGIADRRTSRKCQGTALDLTELRVPLAASFDGPWPTQHRVEGMTTPEDRAPWAECLRRQGKNAMGILLGGAAPFVLMPVGFLLPSPVGPVIVGCLFVVGIPIALIAQVEWKGAVRQGSEEVVSAWLTHWRCPCCDGDFTKSGRWQRWGMGSVLCDRCACIWPLPFQRAVAPSKINCCGKCGYDLAGLNVRAHEVTLCPECGTPARSMTTLRCRGCDAVLVVRDGMAMHAVPCGGCGTINDVRWSIPGSIRPPELFGTGTNGESSRA